MQPRPLISTLVLLAALVIPASTRAATSIPDAAGYSWADSDEGLIDPNVVPPFTQNDLRGMGFTGDDTVVRLTLPTTSFPTGFPFYGRTYTAFWLSSNGWLSFVDPSGNSYPTPVNLPSTGVPNGMVAFYWEDWTLEGGAGSYARGGENLARDGFTMQLRLFNKTNGELINLFVILWSSGVVQVNYLDDSSGQKTPRMSIGIENELGSVGSPYMTSGSPLFNSDFTKNLAVAWYPRPKLDCNGATPLTCPMAATPFSNATGASNVSIYNCSATAWTGNEKVFRLDVTRPTSYTFILNNTDSKNRALFFMKACNEYTSCKVGGSTVLQPKFVSPGTYYLIVDSLTPADNGSFTLEVQCADAAKAATCGQTLFGERTSGTSVFNNWSCAGTMSGPENVYAVTVGGPATLRATMANQSPDFRVMISDAATFNPANPSCITSGSPQATLWGATSGTYYVSVDAVNGSSGTYDLSISCTHNLTCGGAPTIDVTVPNPVSGSTVGKPNRTDTYYCASNAYGPAGETTGYTGGEDIYQFTLAVPSTVSFNFVPSSPNMHLLVVKDCYEGSCAQVGGCAENLAAGTYHVVIDGLAGQTGSYTFTPTIVPPAPYNPWYGCPQECNPMFCNHTPEQIRNRTWHFYDGQFCGNGCNFSLFAVVECGQEFHIPFYDVETGHIRIFDVLGQKYMDLVATNDVPANTGKPYIAYTSTGTTVEWEDQGCPGGAGGDPRTNEVVMDVSFRGTPNVCGIYRIDFIDWGGWDWYVYANCSADRQEQFFLYRDMCSAVANYNPLPEGGISDVTVDNMMCGSRTASGTFTIENVGCLPATGLNVVISQKVAPFNPVSFPVDLVKGESKTINWTYPYTMTPPVLLEFNVDPGNAILECSEQLRSGIACGASGGLERKIEVTACPSLCTTSASAGQPETFCEGTKPTYRLDGSSSSLVCVSGNPQYRWEEGGNPLPGCDWNASATCDVASALLTSGLHQFTLRTRCFNDSPPCESSSTRIVTVIPNVVPPALGNVLRAHKDVVDVAFSWAAIIGKPISGYRIYKGADKRVALATRLPVASAGISETTAVDVGGITSAPSQVAYYQMVGASCKGDLESPY